MKEGRRKKEGRGRQEERKEGRKEGRGEGEGHDYAARKHGDDKALRV